MKGRKPKPTRMKELLGNPGKRRLNAAEPQYASGEPQCPAHLSKEAKAEWRRVAPDLAACNVLTQADRAALAAYCVQWARWVDAEGKLNASGPVLKDPDELDAEGRVTKRGKMYRNPYLGVANEALVLMHSFLSDFGLSPASRSRIKPQNAAAAADPMAEFLSPNPN
jgi:P27 family predicted phage terminase small subunit